MRQRTELAAAAWAGAYGVVALIWTLTSRGYPFHGIDLNVLRNVPASVGAPLFAGVLLGTAVIALAMAGRHAVRLHGAPRIALLTAGWTVVAALLFVVPDVTVLAVAGYAPMLVIGAPFGWPPVDYADVFTWPLVNQLWSVLGGLLLARTVLAWQLRTRRGDLPAWTQPASAARWGRWMAYVAAVIPALYAVTRLAWLAGIPLGISDEMLRDLQESKGVWAGAGLGTFALLGSVLTLGLVQRWGEVFPRWMVGLAGRRVPVRLAVVPASIVAVVVMAASVSLFSSPEILDVLGTGSVAVLPMVLWPLWAVTLGAATLAYHLRRTQHVRNAPSPRVAMDVS